MVSIRTVELWKYGTLSLIERQPAHRRIFFIHYPVCRHGHGALDAVHVQWYMQH